MAIMALRRLALFIGFLSLIWVFAQIVLGLLLH